MQVALSDLTFMNVMNNAPHSKLKTILASALGVMLVSAGIASAYHASAQTGGLNGTVTNATTTATSTTATSTATTTDDTTDNAGLRHRVDELEGEVTSLKSSIASLQANLAALWAAIGNNNGGNTGGNGTSTPTTTPMTASISPQGASVRAGTSIDFGGHGFWYDEPVKITNGSGAVVGTARADGGGNFSTGSMAVGSALGSKTYTFTGQWSGITKTATFTVVE